MLLLQVCTLSFVSVGQMKVAGAFLVSVHIKLCISGSNESSRCFLLKVCPHSFVSMGQMKVAGASLESVHT